MVSESGTSHSEDMGEAPASQPAGRASSLLLAVLLLGLTLFAHRGHAHSFLNWDDDDYVTENPIVRDGFTVDGVRRAFLEAHAANWHPATWISHMADVEIFGLDAHAHQRTSILLHALTALLLLVFLLQATRARAPAFLAAALFALHPQHVESVHWISERKDVLAGVFWMTALLAYFRYARAPSVPRYGLLLLAMLLGTLAKASVITLPIVLLLLDLWPLGRLQHLGSQSRGDRSLRSLVVEKLPLLALSALVAGIALHTQSTYGTTSSLGLVSLPDRIANAGLAVWAYVRQFLIPTGFAAFYPHPALAHPARFHALGLQPLLAAAALVVGIALAWRVRRTQPWILVGVLWFLVVLLPMSGLVQVGEQSRADRYTYLPSMGLGIGLVYWLWVGFGKRSVLLSVVLAPFLVLLVTTTRSEAARWSDTTTLFESELVLNANNWVALNQLGHAALSRGDLDEAETFLRRTIEVHPDSKAIGNLAGIHCRRGAFRKAERNARRALELDDRNAEAANNLGIALAETGRIDEGRASFRRALEIRPSYTDAWINLGRLELSLQRWEEAAASLDRALEIDPRSSEALSLQRLAEARELPR